MKTSVLRYGLRVVDGWPVVIASVGVSLRLLDRGLLEGAADNPAMNETGTGAVTSHYRAKAIGEGLTCGRPRVHIAMLPRGCFRARQDVSPRTSP